MNFVRTDKCQAPNPYPSPTPKIAKALKDLSFQVSQNQGTFKFFILLRMLYLLYFFFFFYFLVKWLFFLSLPNTEL